MAIKVMRSTEEMASVTSPDKVWMAPKQVEDNPEVVLAGQGNRGIIPDGLVQRRLDSFIIAFPNLR